VFVEGLHEVASRGIAYWAQGHKDGASSGG
jgi:hypothetical protein